MLVKKKKSGGGGFFWFCEGRRLFDFCFTLFFMLDQSAKAQCML